LFCLLVSPKFFLRKISAIQFFFLIQPAPFSFYKVRRLVPHTI